VSRSPTMSRAEGSPALPHAWRRRRSGSKYQD
jgi:hypothetical protein